MFAEECTAGCESDSLHVLSTRKVRQAQHGGLPMGPPWAFLAAAAGSSSEQPPSNIHSSEEHNVQKKNRISILFLLLFVIFEDQILLRLFLPARFLAVFAWLQFQAHALSPVGQNCFTVMVSKERV